jgi:hypothetical protein
MRVETIGPGTRVKEIVLRHSLRHRVYVGDAGGRWGSAELTGRAYFVKSSEQSFRNADREEVLYEGLRALRLTRRSGLAIEVRVVVPELDYFAAHVESPAQRLRHYDFAIGPQPESAFEPPPGASVEDFKSIEALNRAMRSDSAR